MRLIDADAFERRCMFDKDINDMQDVIYALRDFPTAKSRPKAMWVHHKDMIKCSSCRRGVVDRIGAIEGLGYNYCPWCGADMRGEE